MRATHAKKNVAPPNLPEIDRLIEASLEQGAHASDLAIIVADRTSAVGRMMAGRTRGLPRGAMTVQAGVSRGDAERLIAMSAQMGDKVHGKVAKKGISIVLIGDGDVQVKTYTPKKPPLRLVRGGS